MNAIAPRAAVRAFLLPRWVLPYLGQVVFQVDREGDAASTDDAAQPRSMPNHRSCSQPMPR